MMFKGLAVAILLTAAPSIAAPQAPPPRVVATIGPLHGLVAAVMDGLGKPALLMKDGGSPHNYALRPSGARALHRAQVIFWIGPALEAFLVRPLKTLGQGARAVALMDAEGITLRGTNAHIWLDPGNARAMVTAMANTLAALDPARAAAYRANGARTLERIDALDKELDKTLAPFRGRPYVVFHDAYRYFQHRYRVPHAAALTRHPERPPGARKLSRVRQIMIRTNVRCAFAEPGTSPALMTALVRGTRASMATLDPLGAALTPGRDTWFTLMRYLAGALTGCLNN